MSVGVTDDWQPKANELTSQAGAESLTMVYTLVELLFTLTTLSDDQMA